LIVLSRQWFPLVLSLLALLALGAWLFWRKDALIITESGSQIEGLAFLLQSWIFVRLDRSPPLRMPLRENRWPSLSADAGPVDAFAKWSQDYLATPPADRAAMVDAGIALAKARRPFSRISSSRIQRWLSTKRFRWSFGSNCRQRFSLSSKTGDEMVSSRIAERYPCQGAVVWIDDDSQGGTAKWKDL